MLGFSSIDRCYRSAILIFRFDSRCGAEEARHRRWIPCLSPLSLYTRNLPRGGFTGSRLVNQACCGNSAPTGNVLRAHFDPRTLSNPGIDPLQRHFFHASRTLMLGKDERANELGRHELTIVLSNVV